MRVPLHSHGWKTLLWQGKALVACLLVFLGLQLSRVYVVIPTEAFICEIPGHEHEAESALADYHHDEEAVSAAIPIDDGHSYVQHCKDGVDNLGLTAGLPYIAPSSVAITSFEVSWLHAPASISSPIQSLIPPPFQPPRA